MVESAPVSPLPAPAHIVLATLGSYGDLYPFLGLGCALAARGHRVTIATHEAYRGKIPAALSFAPLRPDRPDDAAFHDRFMDRAAGPKFVFSDYLAPAIAATYSDLQAAVADADLLVSQSLVLAAPLVAATTKVKWLSAVFQPFTIFSAHDAPHVPPLPLLRGDRAWKIAFNRRMLTYARRWTLRWVEPVTAFRKKLGLPAYGHPIYEGQFSQRGTLAMFPPLYGTPQPDWPPETAQTGAVAYTPMRGSQPLPAAVEAFLKAGTPPLIFTLGSASSLKPGVFYRQAVIIAQNLGHRALLLGDTAITPLPSGMLRYPFLPYADIFPHAAAIVHPGGIGTSVIALNAGRPQLIVPYAHDQHDNARRLARQGLAIVIPEARFTVRRGVAALKDLLNRQQPEPQNLIDGAAATVARIEAVLAA